MQRKFIIISSLIASQLFIGCDTKKGTSVNREREFEDIAAKYNTSVPHDILTPNKVTTSIGELNYFDGMPTEETTQKLYDNLDHLRGIETFLNGIPAASLESFRRGVVSMGADNYNKVGIFDQLMGSNAFFLTGNTSTVYASVFLDLKKDGPMVIEVPKGCGPATVNDAFFRYVIDMGLPGPDRGKGGKYLILPPDYKGNVPDHGYYVATSKSYVNWVILRGFLVDQKPDYSSQLFRNGLKVYPYKKKETAPKMEFIDMSSKTFNTIHANDFHFYEELNAVIQREPISLIDPELRGIFSSIGIEKGKLFQPDAHKKAILTDAVKVANGTARALAFNPRDKEAKIYPESNWESGFIGGNYQWLKDEGKGGRNLDARSRFFYMATVNTPAMTWKLEGIGSQYAISSKDSDDHYFDGGKNYTLHLPKDVPAKNFWSVCVYDPQTRSELQTGQRFPSINSQRNPLQKNTDGSYTLYFGPNSPKGHESNWIQTVPGKGWFTILRLYGPLNPWFNKTWEPGEIVLQRN
ncbi:DUF1254 domain-containing protein [Flammeovirga sp. SubArs3]|uniref:DUF1254 domain-containing protein n=1 Tax=Flammeovirga sp. SubArs3 TaxID=2995316 RepID=UPI00248C5C11|nr:DUF1254 domain-containing protein [Flammeovirga sp. SubArs3]